MAMETTQSAEIQESLSAVRSACIVLSACCVCELIRDETKASPAPERWVTQKMYHQTHGVNSDTCLLSHTYCPECFTQFMDRMKAA